MTRDSYRRREREIRRHIAPLVAQVRERRGEQVTDDGAHSMYPQMLVLLGIIGGLGLLTSLLVLGGWAK